MRAASCVWWRPGGLIAAAAVLHVAAAAAAVLVFVAALQERVQIQKYVCQGCTHTWRSDD